MKMAAQAVYEGRTVQYEVLEGTEEQVALRFQSMLGSLMQLQVPDMMALLKGQGNLDEYKKFVQRIERKCKGSFFTASPSGGTKIGPLQIEAQIERNGPDIVFVDYLTLLDYRHDMDWSGIGRLTKELKNIALRYRVPIVAAAQLNRERGLSKDVPGAEALGQSDQIGQDADAVITLKRESERVLKMRLAKYRHGPDGYTWHNEFDPLVGRFREIGYERACELRDSDDMLKED